MTITAPEINAPEDPTPHIVHTDLVSLLTIATHGDGQPTVTLHLDRTQAVAALRATYRIDNIGLDGYYMPTYAHLETQAHIDALDNDAFVDLLEAAGIRVTITHHADS